jgi:hypothetical protein
MVPHQPSRRNPLYLSRFTKVLGRSEGWSISGMDMELKASQEGLGRLNEPVEIVPPAVAGELLLHIVPEALDKVELRGVGRQPEVLEAVGMLLR